VQQRKGAHCSGREGAGPNGHRMEGGGKAPLFLARKPWQVTTSSRVGSVT
jgi:hypothetical protein